MKDQIEEMNQLGISVMALTMDAAVLESVINSFSVLQTALKSQIAEDVCQLTPCDTFKDTLHK